MTSTKLPPDSELATPVVGDKPSADLQAKLTDDEQRHKRARFKSLIFARLKELKFRMKQVKNCGNRSNYVYTEREAKAIIGVIQQELDDLADVFLDTLKDFNAEPIQFDTTEYD